jgi:hypothetical protein
MSEERFSASFLFCGWVSKLNLLPKTTQGQRLTVVILATQGQWFMPIIDVYNPSWDWEDHGLRPAHTNSSRDPHLQNNYSKNGLEVWLKWWKPSPTHPISPNKKQNKERTMSRTPWWPLLQSWAVSHFSPRGNVRDRAMLVMELFSKWQIWRLSYWY